jgi:DUF1680 family protein
VWKTGDKIELSLPMGLHSSPMPDDETIQAAMYGPLVLAGRFDPVARETSYGDYHPKTEGRQKVPDIVSDPGKPLAWIEPDSKQALTFHAVGQAQPFSLVPLNSVIHERYAVYWRVKPRSS